MFLFLEIIFLNNYCTYRVAVHRNCILCMKWKLCSKWLFGENYNELERRRADVFSLLAASVIPRQSFDPFIIGISNNCHGFESRLSSSLIPSLIREKWHLNLTLVAGRGEMGLLIPCCLCTDLLTLKPCDVRELDSPLPAVDNERIQVSFVLKYWPVHF